MACSARVRTGEVGVAASKAPKPPPGDGGAGVVLVRSPSRSPLVVGGSGAVRTALMEGGVARDEGVGAARGEGVGAAGDAVAPAAGTPLGSW